MESKKIAGDNDLATASSAALSSAALASERDAEIQVEEPSVAHRAASELLTDGDIATPVSREPSSCSTPRTGTEHFSTPVGQLSETGSEKEAAASAGIAPPPWFSQGMEEMAKKKPRGTFARLKSALVWLWAQLRHFFKGAWRWLALR